MRYTIRNWSKFQHYKDRCPPWIKLHFGILASEDWVMLDDRNRLLAVVCMLVASRNDGEVPDNPAYLQRIAYLSEPPDLSPLVASGFLLQADDSGCKQEQAKDTTEERREERGEEKERDFSPSRCASQKQLAMLQDIADERGVNLRAEAGRLNSWPIQRRHVTPMLDHLRKCERPARPDLEPLTDDESERLIKLEIEGEK